MVIVSVRPSVTTRYRLKTGQDRDIGFSPYDSFMSLVFCDWKFVPLSQRGPLEQKGETEAPPLKRCYFSTIRSFSVTMVADRHRYAGYHYKHWRRAS